MLADAIEKIPADKIALALGPCYEALGNFDEAAKQYHATLAKGDSDPVVLRNVAEFCVARTGPTRLKDTCRGSLEDRSPLNCRTLPGPAAPRPPFFANGAGTPIYSKAVALSTRTSPAVAVDDLREKAVLLAAFPQRAKRLEAIAGTGAGRPIAALRNGGGPFHTGLSCTSAKRTGTKASEHMQALLANHGR